MLKANSNALAIEAKWTEPMYPTVSKWITQGTNEKNRRLELAGWLSYLQERVEKNLVPADFDDAIYQMVHRAASAAAAGDHPRLAYFLFKSSSSPKGANPENIKKKLFMLWEKLGNPKSFPFYTVEIEIDSLKAHKAIRELPKGEKTSELVTAALQAESPLFAFKDIQIERVGEDA